MNPLRMLAVLPLVWAGSSLLFAAEPAPKDESSRPSAAAEPATQPEEKTHA